MIKTKILTAESLTVIAVYMRIKGKNKCLLESSPREEDQRFSIISWNPVGKISYSDGVLNRRNVNVLSQDPLKDLEKDIRKDVEELELPFTGGAIGYASYDLAGVYEEIGESPKDDLGVPDMQFYMVDSFLIFDHHKEIITLVEMDLYSGRTEEELEEALIQTEKELKQMTSEEFKKPDLKTLQFKSNLTQGEFEHSVREAKKKIINGDLFQIVLSQRFEADFEGHAFDYYRKLRLSNPSAYMYFFEFDGLYIVGSSPESLVSVRGNKVITNPIAGTRKRGKSKEEDTGLAEELLMDEKERAEHQMLVDLGRNDVGRIAERGSVNVPIYMTIEKFRHVMHIVSVVEGKLQDGYTAMDALKATLPAGTVSGAPKIRAMREIYQLENVKRSIYAGAVGYFSSDGQADFAIAIRTMIICNQKAYIQSGAGIVYDSDPKKEYEETLQKAKGLMEVCKA